MRKLWLKPSIALKLFEELKLKQTPATFMYI